MLGYVFLYFLGKAFYKLAQTHGKSQWTFGVLGVLSYFLGQLLLAFLVGALIAVINVDWYYELEDNTMVLSAMGIVLGLSTSGILYFVLKKRWEGLAQAPKSFEDILDLP